jgi:threonine synthase
VSFVKSLQCTVCRRVDTPEASEYTCLTCGGIREVEFDYAKIGRVFSRSSLASDHTNNMLRYGPLLPIDLHKELPPLAVGFSPTHEAPRMAKELGVARMFVKNDGVLPTGSLKDRASYIGVARAAQSGRTAIAAASTGNAGTSLAGIAASIGLQANIFVPAAAPEAKIAQLCIFGARLFLVKANYDRTYDLCQEAVARFGWYDRSAAVNPYLVEGKKTCGHEIAEQMFPHGTPDWVAMSVGDGCSIAGCYKGLHEMKLLGVSDRVPKMLGVQARGANVLKRTFDAGDEKITRMEDAATLADSINVGMPRNPLKALRAVQASGGTFVDVEDSEILEWIPKTARLSGVFAEPTAIAAVAGVARARSLGIILPNETVLAVLTGTGLKDIRTAMRSTAAPLSIEPNLRAVEAAVSAFGGA